MKSRTQLRFHNPFCADLLLNGKPLGTLALSQNPASEAAIKISRNGKDFWVNDTSALPEAVIEALRLLYAPTD